MARVRFLANMNISPLTVQGLQTAGWDTVRVNQVLPAKSRDAVVLDWARREDRVMLTQDLDYSALLAVGGWDRPSVVSIRIALASPEAVLRRLLQTLPGIEDELVSGSAVTVDESSVRVRRLPIR